MITVNPHLQNIQSYVPGATPEQIRVQFGLDHVEKLASNENPLGCSPAARSAAANALEHVNRYNDGGQALRVRLAEFHGVSLESVSVNNGSDSIIPQIMRAFLLPGQTALSSEGTFVSFRLAVASADRHYRLVPMTPQWGYDLEALASAIDETTKVIYIANPNNPTGSFIERDKLMAFLDRVPDRVLVVLDEAYIEYARHLHPESCPTDADVSRANVLRLRTFSKAYGLAAMRIGYAVGHPDVIKWLIRTKLPFDPNGIGCQAAIAAIDDQEFVLQSVELNAECLAMMTAAARQAGFNTISSSANFVMIDLGSADAATSFHRRLLEGGFISRPLAGFGLPTCVRISTGTIEQSRALSALLQHIGAADGSPVRTSNHHIPVV